MSDQAQEPEPEFTELSVYDIFDQADKDGILKEAPYPIRELKVRYNLTDQQADDLAFLINQTTEDPKYNVYGFLQRATHDSEIAKKVCGYMLDALHGNLDGWDWEHDRITIQRFLSDVTFGIATELETDDEEENTDDNK